MIADTSFLVALHSPGDKHHATARKVNLYRDRILIPSPIWYEFCQTVGLRLPAETAKRVLANATDGPFAMEDVLTPDQAAALATRLRPIAETLARQEHRPLSLFDAVVCQISAQYREPILTYDDGIVAAVRSNLFPGARLG